MSFESNRMRPVLPSRIVATIRSPWFHQIFCARLLVALFMHMPTFAIALYVNKSHMYQHGCTWPQSLAWLTYIFSIQINLRDWNQRSLWLTWSWYSSGYSSHRWRRRAKYTLWLVFHLFYLFNLKSDSNSTAPICLPLKIWRANSSATPSTLSLVAAVCTHSWNLVSLLLG